MKKEYGRFVETWEQIKLNNIFELHSKYAMLKKFILYYCVSKRL